VSQLRVHHVGYVVRDIEAFASSMPGLTLKKTVEDPLQNAKLSLYSVGDSSYVELIQPSDASSFTWAHLQRTGEGLHHICYEGILKHEIEPLFKKHRLFKVRGPIFAPLFEREVVFAITRQRAILEFLL
jgi:Glyoxalase/Bleomycin resistance protein/Dioxygenase superfamily